MTATDRRSWSKEQRPQRRGQRINWARTCQELQNELVDGEELIQIASNGAKLGRWSCGLSRGIETFGLHWAQILGEPVDEACPIEKLKWDRWIHPDDVSAAGVALSKYLTGKLPDYSAEVRLRQPDGGYLWILDMGRMSLAGETPLQMRGYYLEITERKKAEGEHKAALRLSEERAAELDILRYYADELNQVVTLTEVAQIGIEAVLAFSGAEAAWLLAVEGNSVKRLHVAFNPSPGPEVEARTPDFPPDCRCLQRLRSGEMPAPEFIPECEWLRQARTDPRGTCGHVSLPIFTQRRQLGLLNLAMAGMPSENAMTMLVTISAQLSVAMERAVLFTEIAEALEREHKLNEVSRNMTQGLQLEATLENAVRQTVGLLQAEAGVLGLLSDDGLRLTFPFFYNLPANRDWQVLLKGEALAWQVLGTGESMLYSGGQPSSGAVADMLLLGVKTLMIVPVKAGNEVLGVIGLYTFETNRTFSQRDVSLAEVIGHQAGTAIQNARLFMASIRRSEELNRRDAILDAVGFAAGEFLQALDWQEKIEGVLQQIGAASRAVRITVYRVKESPENETERLYLWPASDSGAGEISGLMDPADFARWRTDLQAGRLIYDRSETSRDHLPGDGLHMVVVAPIFLGQQWWGVMRFHEPTSERQWSKSEYEALKTAADILGAAIQQQETVWALRQSEAENRALLASIPDVIFRLRRDGLVTGFTGSREQISLPVAPEGHYIQELMPEQVTTLVMDAMKNLFGGQGMALLEYDTKTPQLGRQTFEIRLARLGKDAVLGMVRNISERVHLEQMKSDFINRAAHDLRTPLTAALLMVDLIREGGTEEELVEYWRVLQMELDRQRALVEELLTVGRLETGSFQIQPQPMNLATVLREAGEAVMTAAIDRHVVLDVNLPIEQPVVMGDRSGLRQVFINLLDNSVKFSSEGQRVEMFTVQEGGGIWVTVADHGMGIPEEDIDDLFSRFFRASNAIEKEVPGTGIGLYIVRSIIERLNGKIEVHSNVNEGTTMRIWLPLALPTEPE